MAKRRLVVANWKMYVESPEEAKRFASGLRRRSRLFSGVDAVIAPAFPLIPVVAAALKGSTIKVGAQAVYPPTIPLNKAQTGFVSVEMLKNSGVTHVIVGHSERRGIESDAEVAAELAAVAGAGLTSVLCVGERERDAAGGHFTFIENQLSSALGALAKAPLAKIPKIIIAYEPVWAIGRSAEEAMRPADLRETSIFIKKTLSDIFDRSTANRIPILYGGSVESSNAAQLMREGDVAGFLVGHASADLNSFVAILQACKS